LLKRLVDEVSTWYCVTFSELPMEHSHQIKIVAGEVAVGWGAPIEQGSIFLCKGTQPNSFDLDGNEAKNGSIYKELHITRSIYLFLKHTR